MNKKIAMSALSIVSSLVIMGGATYAAFTTQATLANNTFATGNADLLIANDNSGTPDPFAATIPGVDIDGIFPGFTTDKLFWLRNESDSAIGLNVRGDLSNLGGAFHGTDGSLPDKMRVQFSCDTDGNGLGVGTDTTTGNYTVREWINGGDDAMGVLAQNQQFLCKMIASLDVNAGNELQDSDISFNAIFNGSQVANPSVAPSATPTPSPSASPSASPSVSPSPIPSPTS